MKRSGGSLLRLSALCLLSGLSLVTAAQAREQRHEADRRHVERRVDDWRFERGRGWRFEHHPGVWSPYYVWWWTNGRMAMLPAPTATVVQYPNGRYELRGDGIAVPYYWAWVPAQAYIAAPPPPAVPAAPDMPPAGSPPPPPPAG